MTPHVAHISYADLDGGAARGTFGLHQSLLKSGIDSRLYVSKKYSVDPTVVGPRTLLGRIGVSLRWRAEVALPRLLNRPEELFTTNLLGSAAVRRALRQQPDVLHLHWVGLGTVRPERLAGLGLPIVWTLRDMWAFTGGCHLDLGCGRFSESCGRCPILRSSKDRDLSSWTLARKKRSWSDEHFHIVALSRWLARAAGRSALFGDKPIRVICPGVDTSVFLPLDRQRARSELALPQRTTILFVATHVNLVHKGLDRLVDALEQLRHSGRAENFQLVLVGQADRDPTELSRSFPVVAMGPVKDDERLRLLYCAADVTAAPSLQESFGKVSIESMACGTPVVAFAATGFEESIQHGVTGYLAKWDDRDDLARGLHMFLDHGDPGQVASQARQHVLARFTNSYQADRYAELYDELLDPAKVT